jgi:hypothetical protein
MTLDKTLMPVPDGHPAVFERSWPLRVGDIDRSGRRRKNEKREGRLRKDSECPFSSNLRWSGPLTCMDQEG